MPQPPPCKPQSKSKHPQSKSKPQGKSKGKSKPRRKNVRPTKTIGKPLPTLPPFDFESYLREKDNRDFELLIDQPEKCHLRGAEEDEGGEGGSRGSATAAPYMLIAVKSIAADFDKRQVKYAMFYINYKRLCVTFVIFVVNQYRYQAVFW